MYQSIVKSQEEAVCHLFLHCCMKDGKLKGEELDLAAEKIVRLNIHKSVDVKLETRRYVEYSSSISNQQEYLEFLTRIITPVNALAIFSYCVELVLGDDQIQPGEETLLADIRNALQVSREEHETIQKLLVQRKITETQKIF